MRLGVAAALVGGELRSGDVEVVDGRVVAVGLGGARGSGIAARVLLNGEEVVGPG